MELGKTSMTIAYSNWTQAVTSGLHLGMMAW